MLRHVFSEEVTFDGDPRMSWELIREESGKGVPGEITAEVKAPRKVVVELRGWRLRETESV